MHQAKRSQIYLDPSRITGVNDSLEICLPAPAKNTSTIMPTHRFC